MPNVDLNHGFTEQTNFLIRYFSVVTIFKYKTHIAFVSELLLDLRNDDFCSKHSGFLAHLRLKNGKPQTPQAHHWYFVVMVLEFFVERPVMQF